MKQPIPPVVVNFNRFHGEMVKITRETVWGNPYVIGRHGTREEVLALYAEYVDSCPYLQSLLHTLEGKRLGCGCHPLACHGDVLVRAFKKKFGIE